MLVRSVLFFGLFFSAIALASAQSSRVDSLVSLVKSVPADTIKVSLLNAIVQQLREKDNNRAFSYAVEARELAEQLGDKKGHALALENLGWIHYRKGNYAKSFDLSLQALKINEQLELRAGIGRCLINLAAIHYEQKQYRSAINKLRAAYNITLEVDDKTSMARSLNNIGYAYIELNELDSALMHIRKSLDITNNSGNLYMVAFSNRTIGDIHLLKNEALKAREYFERSLELAKQEGNKFMEVSTLHRLGKVHAALGRSDLAVDYLYENIAIAEKFGFREELEQTYKLISEIFYLRKNIAKAYEYQSKYVSMHDSLYDQRNDEQMALMQARFDSELKEAQIELLTKESLLKEEELAAETLWRYFYIACLALVTIVSLLLYYYARATTRAKKILQEKNEEINKQATQLRNLNATKDKLFSIISHDLRSPVASLRALMELLNTSNLTQQEFIDVTRSLKRNLDSVYDDLDNLLLWAQTQLRGLQVSPETIDLHKLADEKVQLFKEQARSKNISLVNDIDRYAKVCADRNHISLVFRNLIANAIKFNKPGGSIVLSSALRGDIYEISVSDSGVGIGAEDLRKLFNAETHFSKPGTNKEKGAGIGLLLTREFIESNHGTISVASELGSGTTFTFTLQAQLNEILVDNA